MKSVVWVSALLLIALVYLALPAPSHAPAKERESVRKMAEFLQSQPAGVTAMGATSPQGIELSRPSERSVASGNGPKDGPDHFLANRAARARTDGIEQNLEGRYPRTDSGALLRRYVALALSGVDTDYQPELSRLRLLNELMKDAPRAALEIQGILAALPRDQGDAEAGALITAASYLGGNEVAKLTVESVLSTEMGRRGGHLSEEQEEGRLNHLIDSYTSLVTDSQKRQQFIRGGLEVQEHPRSRQLLLEAMAGQSTEN